ncbi:MAG: hypothetical protein P1U36_06530 [Legionellaceae bacterium]|nr:hypothetical protein [Legionellaceae bacterium]
MNNDIDPQAYESNSSRAIALAQQINQRKLMLSLYGFFDGLDIASKTLVLLMPLISTSALSAWVLTPDGFYLSLMFVTSLAILSAFGNAFNGSKNNIEKSIFRFWQSMRDTIKGGKIAHKAVKNILALTRVLSADANLKPMILALAVPIALLFITNRFVTRYLSNQRKDAQSTNKALLKTLENLWAIYANAAEGTAKEITKQNYLDFVANAQHHQIATQSQLTQYTLFVSSFIETMINGNYVFMGAALLAPASPEAVIFITCVSMTMLLINIISAWHEERENQIKRQRTEQVFHVACAVHALQLSLESLHTLQSNHFTINSQLQIIEQKRLALEHEHNKQDALYKSTFGEALFVGLRYTVAAHKAIMGALVFMTLLSGLLLGAALTESIVLGCMGLSITAMISLSIYSFEETRQKITRQNQYIQQQRTQITSHVNQMIHTNMPSVHSHSMFTQHTKPPLLGERNILKETEKARACFSGSKKPNNLCEFVLRMQGKSEHDMPTSPGAKLLLLFSMTCYCVLWWAKAHDKQYPAGSNLREVHATPATTPAI